MLPPQIGTEIAARALVAAKASGLKSAHYPAIKNLPALPTLVVMWDSFDVTESNEQFLILRYRGLLFTSLDKVEAQVASVDGLVIPIVDAFSPNLNRRNFRLETDTDYVDYCKVTTGALSVPIQYNEKIHYGGRLQWEVKVRRYAGDGYA